MGKLRYGLIGAGMMGQEHIRNIHLLGDTAIGAIFEPNADMCEAACQLAPEAGKAESLEALLADDSLDCLLISSPNHLHIPQLKAIAAASEGQRALPILCEKPLLTDPDDASFIQALDKQYQAPIWVAMEYRYMPPVARLITDAKTVTGGIKMLAIREHRFPFLEKVDNWNRFNHQSGGTFVEKCCHFFDLMRHILEAEPVRVMASGGQAHNHLDEIYAQGRSDIWDHGFVIVDFDNGARAMLDLCMFAEGSLFQEEISAVGPKGKMEAKLPGPSRFWDPAWGDEPISQVIISPRHPKMPIIEPVEIDPALLAAGDHHGSTYYQHQKFLEVVRGTGKVEVGLADGLKAVQMGMAAQRSAILNEAVSV